jgi:hypothetical protein
MDSLACPICGFHSSSSKAVREHEEKCQYLWMMTGVPLVETAPPVPQEDDNALKRYLTARKV